MEINESAINTSSLGMTRLALAIKVCMARQARPVRANISGTRRHCWTSHLRNPRASHAYQG